MIARKLKPKIQALLDKVPAVVLMGPRQVGKTTLAYDIAPARNSVYLDLMVDLLLVRRLQQWTSNLGRRLVKAPKVYVRDSGVCHELLGIETLYGLLGQTVVGGSWEGFIIENIIAALPRQAQFGYYRTTGGAEIDLVIDLGRAGFGLLK